jgi:SWI/SNF-related matrix-associated actin-dependent regulator of chromatin subfamily A3
LNQIRIRLIRLKQKVSLTFEEVAKGEEVFQIPKLILNEDLCDIQSQEGISVAIMHEKVRLALRSLSLEHKLHYQGLIPKVKFREKLDIAVQPIGLASSDLTISMSVLVFGLRSIADLIAKALSRHRLYLQHPSISTAPYLYENPQYPRMITPSFSNGTLIPPIHLAANHAREEVDALSDAVNDGPEDLIDIINNIPRHDYLSKETNIDSRVKAILLP